MTDLEHRGVQNILICYLDRVAPPRIGPGSITRHPTPAPRSCGSRTEKFPPLLGALGTHGLGWVTAMPYGLLPVATVAVSLRVLGSMIDSVFAPWLTT